MANELTELEQNQLSVLTSHDISDIIKPLTKDIFLMDTLVSYENISGFPIIDVGEELILQRAPEKYLPNSIMVLTKNKEYLGYISEAGTDIIARLMDTGKLIKAYVKSYEKWQSLPIIKISLYMTDV